MGIHFDGLVELVRHTIDPREPSVDREGYTAIPNIKEYLEGLVRRAKYFEFPTSAESIRPQMDLDRKKYGDYLKDFFAVSQRYHRHLITPFPMIAIEDKESVVFLEHMEDNIYRATAYNEGIQLARKGYIDPRLLIGDITLGKPEDSGNYPCFAHMLYAHLRKGDHRIPCSLEKDTAELGFASYDLVQSAISMIEQNIYIMDPANFIIERESNACKKQNEKERRSKKNKLRKSINRPHYFCLGKEDVRSFLQNESKEPYPAHPVVGYWKTLTSPRWKNVRYQEKYIAQYWTGNGEFLGRNGWNYRVFIKTAPDKVVPYSRARELQQKKVLPVEKSPSNRFSYQGPAK